MEEERSASPRSPQEADMSEIHRRYFLVLVVIVIFAGVFSYSTPAAVYRMLHAHEDGLSPMTYSVVSDGAPGGSAALPDNVGTLIAGAKCTHMVQKDAEMADGSIIVYPAEQTGYALVFLPDGEGYVYAEDAGKFRGKVTDDGGAIYAAVSALEK